MTLFDLSRSYEKEARSKLCFHWKLFAEKIEHFAPSRSEIRIIPNYIWINHSFDRFAEDEPNGLSIEYAICIKNETTGSTTRYKLLTRISNTYIESKIAHSSMELYSILKVTTETAIVEFKSYLLREQDKTFNFSIDKSNA